MDGNYNNDSWFGNGRTRKGEGIQRLFDYLTFDNVSDLDELTFLWNSTVKQKRMRCQTIFIVLSSCLHLHVAHTYVVGLI